MAASVFISSYFYIETANEILYDGIAYSVQVNVRRTFRKLQGNCWTWTAMRMRIRSDLAGNSYLTIVFISFYMFENRPLKYRKIALTRARNAQSERLSLHFESIAIPFVGRDDDVVVIWI